MEILICMDALEAESLRVLPLGLLARNIQVGLEPSAWGWVWGGLPGGGGPGLQARCGRGCRSEPTHWVEEQCPTARRHTVRATG